MWGPTWSYILSNAEKLRMKCQICKTQDAHPFYEGKCEDCWVEATRSLGATPLWENGVGNPHSDDWVMRQIRSSKRRVTRKGEPYS